MPKVLNRGKIIVDGKEYDLSEFDDTKSFTSKGKTVLGSMKKDGENISSSVNALNSGSADWHKPKLGRRTRRGM